VATGLAEGKLEPPTRRRRRAPNAAERYVPRDKTAGLHQWGQPAWQVAAFTVRFQYAGTPLRHSIKMPVWSSGMTGSPAPPSLHDSSLGWMRSQVRFLPQASFAVDHSSMVASLMLRPGSRGSRASLFDASECGAFRTSMSRVTAAASALYAPALASHIRWSSCRRQGSRCQAQRSLPPRSLQSDRARVQPAADSALSKITHQSVRHGWRTLAESTLSLRSATIRWHQAAHRLIVAVDDPAASPSRVLTIGASGWQTTAIPTPAPPPPAPQENLR
jgi:hypothetical protein